MPAPGRLRRLPGVAADSAAGKAILHDGQEFIRIEWLRDDVQRAECPRHLEQVGVATAPAAGDGDDLRVGPGLAHLGNGLDAFLLRHDDVGDDQVRLLAAEHRPDEYTVVGGQDVVAGVPKDVLDRHPYSSIVVDDQYIRHVF